MNRTWEALEACRQAKAAGVGEGLIFEPWMRLLEVMAEESLTKRLASTLKAPWIQTTGGHALDLLNPDYSAITIEEVAWSLAGIARWTGHTRPSRYSVAQHSVIVSLNCPTMVQYEGLMHDAHEAGIGDWSTPVKIALRALGGGEAVEQLDRLHAAAVRKRFDVMDPMPPHVKVADTRALLTERRDLLGDTQARPWEVQAEPFAEHIDRVWSHEEAYERFLARFEELGGRQ